MASFDGALPPGSAAIRAVDTWLRRTSRGAGPDWKYTLGLWAALDCPRTRWNSAISPEVSSFDSGVFVGPPRLLLPTEMTYWPRRANGLITKPRLAAFFEVFA